MSNSIHQWCLSHRREQLQLLKTLAAIPAPSHQEHRRAEFIRNWLTGQGCVGAFIDEAVNVVLPIGDDGVSPFRVIMAHTDVVFPDTDCLPVREEGGMLLAPGVGDDTANVAALMLCAKYLFTEQRRPAVPVLLVFNSCEEGLGNLKGVKEICRCYAGRIRELVSFDCGWDWLVNRAVGSHRYSVRVSTFGGHSFGDFGNPNAIAHLASLIHDLYRQPVPQKDGSATTYNVGTIQGGTSVNTIAQDASMTYEYRSDDRECLSIMERQFQDILAKHSCDGVKITVSTLGIRPCGENVPEKAQKELLKRCSRAISAVTGDSPRLCAASTDANIPLSLGIPAATFGLYRGGGAHTREEYVWIDSLNPGLEIGLTFLLEDPA